MNLYTSSPRYEQELSIINQSSAQNGTIVSEFSNQIKISIPHKQIRRAMDSGFDQVYEKKRINSLPSVMASRFSNINIHDKQNLINESNKISIDLQTKQKMREILTIQSQALSYEHEAKIEIAKQQKLYKIFSFWKNAYQKKNHFRTQIVEEEMIMKKQLKTKYSVLKAWKAETIIYKRVVQYHQKKIYRNFFMVCSFELQLRLRSIYLEQLLRMNRFPKILKSLIEHKCQIRLKAERFIKKMKLKRLIKQAKIRQIQNKTKRLAKLYYELNSKRKFWLLLCENSNI